MDTDEYPRNSVTIDMLAKLKPAFKQEGTVTAGNSSGINDGAAALVICSKDKANELGLTPLARIRSYASAGVDPKLWVLVQYQQRKLLSNQLECPFRILV